MNLTLTLLALSACSKDQIPVDSGDTSVIYPYVGQIASGNIPKVYVNGEEISVGEITPEILATATSACPVESSSYALDNGEVVYDTTLINPLSNIPNSSKRLTRCHHGAIGSIPYYSGYSSVIPESGSAETFDYTVLTNEARSHSSDSEVWPYFENMVELENGQWLIPYLNRDTGVAGFMSYDHASGQTSLIYEGFIPVEGELDETLFSKVQVSDGLVIINCLTNIYDRNLGNYLLTKTFVFDASVGTLLSDIEWDETPIFEPNAQALEGNYLEDLYDTVELHLTEPIYYDGFLYFISTPEIAYNNPSGLAQQAAASTLIRYNLNTENREEIALPINGISKFFFDEVSNQFILIAYHDPELVEEDTYQSHSDLNFYFMDVETESLSQEQTLLEDVTLGSVNLVPRTLEEDELIWNNTFVVQHSTRNPDLEIWHDYYEYDSETETYGYSRTENASREIRIDNFEYTTNDGRQFSLAPANSHAITFQSDAIVFEGYNGDYVYVDPVRQEAFYFRNISENEEGCILFEVGGEIYSSCTRKAGSVTLKDEFLFFAVDENVFEIAIPESP